jgi:hypothetical protein
MDKNDRSVEINVSGIQIAAVDGPSGAVLGGQISIF